MDRIRTLDRCQKVILLLLSAGLVLFTTIYFIVSARVGFAYKDVILPPREENGTTIYAGRVKGKSASFVVTPDKTVTFHYADRTYGPYTARKDPTAIPKDSAMAQYMTGVEIREGDEVFFRGAVLPSGSNHREWMVFDEAGGLSSVTFSITSNGIIYDAEGNVVDQMAPSPHTILRLMADPELTSKGAWVAWFFAVILSVVTAVSILFADEFFRISLTFVVRNVDLTHAQPSELQLTRRYIGWIFSTVIVLILYIAGLTL